MLISNSLKFYLPFCALRAQNRCNEHIDLRALQFEVARLYCRTFIRQFLMLTALVACSAGVSLHAQNKGSDSVADPKQKMSAALSRQKSAVQQMQLAVERQRNALQLQAHTEKNDGFFLLPQIAGTPRVTYQPDCVAVPAQQAEVLIDSAAAREGVPSALVLTVAEHESALRPCAESDKGAMGVMQLMPTTAEQFNVANPFDPEESINAGTKLLKELMKRYGGNLALTLAAYNAGPARVDAIMDVPKIPETQNYVRDILASPALRGLLSDDLAGH